MLTIEQKKENGGIAIRLRDRDRWWSSTLLRALALAVALHGSGALLFTIQPFRLQQEWQPIPPASVETDLTEADTPTDPHITSQLDTERRKRRFPLMPQTSSPALPAIEIVREKSLQSTEIAAIAPSELFHTDNSGPFDFDSPTMAPPITMQLFGELEGLSHNWESKKEQAIAPFANQLRYRVEAQLHPKSGVLFWWYPREVEGDRSLIPTAEELLAKLRFSTNRKSEIIRGQIELILTQEAK